MKKLIVLAIVMALSSWAIVGAEEKRWVSGKDKDLMTFLEKKYRPCINELIPKYQEVYICYENERKNCIGVCRNDSRGHRDMEDFWDDMDKCRGRTKP